MSKEKFNVIKSITGIKKDMIDYFNSLSKEEQEKVIILGVIEYCNEDDFE